MLATFLQKCSQHFGLGTIGGKNVAHDSLFHQYIYIYIYIYIYTYIHIYICIYIEPNTPISLDVVFHFIHFTTYCVPFHYEFHFNIHCSEPKMLRMTPCSTYIYIYIYTYIYIYVYTYIYMYIYRTQHTHFTRYCVPFHPFHYVLCSISLCVPFQYSLFRGKKCCVWIYFTT